MASHCILFAISAVSTTKSEQPTTIYSETVSGARRIMSDVGGKMVCLGSDYERNLGHVEAILANIFCRLPVKDLARCRAVSPMWNGLIREQHFTKLHFAFSQKNPKLVTCYLGFHHNLPANTDLCLVKLNRQGNPAVTFCSFDSAASLHLLFSFNGLVCCMGVRGRVLQICNPATRECKTLPAGSPCVLSPLAGAVYDPKNFNYKLYRFFSSDSGSEVYTKECEVYVPGTEVWTRVVDIPCPSRNRAYPSAPSHVNVGGKLYWLVWSDDFEVPTYIFSVDVEDTFTRIELPEYAINSKTFNRYTHLVEFKDRLLLINMKHNDDKMFIWSLESDQQSFWFYVGPVRHNIPIRYTRYIGCIASVKNEIIFVVNHEKDDVVLYRVLNMDDMTWRVVRFSSELNELLVIMFPFAESLLKCDVIE